jgi:heme oxygenase (mycobilin-producing)
MSVRILIRRNVPENKEKEFGTLLRKMRALASHQPGYISGETLKRLDRGNESLVISTWQSIAAWEAWMLSTDRTQIQSEIDMLLGEDTECCAYAYSD